jgi:hypothetical protein
MDHIQSGQKQQSHQQKDDADGVLEERIFGKHALQVLPLQLDLMLVVDHLFGLDKQRSGIVLVDQGGRKQILPGHFLAVQYLHRNPDRQASARRIQDRGSQFPVHNGFQPGAAPRNGIDPHKANPVRQSGMPLFDCPAGSHCHHIVMGEHNVNLLQRIHFGNLLLHRFRLPFPEYFLHLNAGVQDIRKTAMAILRRGRTGQAPYFQHGGIFLFHLAVHEKAGLTTDLVIVAANVSRIFVRTDLPVYQDSRDAGTVGLDRNGSDRFRLVGGDNQQIDLPLYQAAYLLHLQQTAVRGILDQQGDARIFGGLHLHIQQHRFAPRPVERTLRNADHIPFLPRLHPAGKAEGQKQDEQTDVSKSWLHCVFRLPVCANVRRNGVPANIYFVHSSLRNQLSP